ncbi:glycosyltransferase family 4 protein [Butyrivibrio sp. CB08]|uniref:glycosyltransferase n=1 Tax=Butyrivibrio sp. CB08 TaxID=2364879 RepID=UPI000EA9685A|nr:glycosyltransferase [Butyrivibrio sp. CB08]RKM59806.1 glycosyltransferase family 4 protein [Butyrivibrio sp. CB08]
MKKIAFHVSSLAQGGAERVVANLANRFAQDGFEVYVATEEYGNNEFELVPEVKRVHVGLKEEDEKKNRIVKFLLRVKYLKHFVKEYKPDVLVAFAHRCNYRALMAAGNSNIPVVISIRINPIGYYDAFSDDIQIRWLFPKAAGCVYQTQEQKDFFKPYLQDNSRIIMNPINPKYFGNPLPEVREKAVMHHARLVDFKNQPMLVRAFLKVHEKHPDYVLKIFGPDSGDGTKQILEKLIHDNNAESFVFLMGSSSELEKEIPKGEIYAYSSDYEGMPNSLLEAMAMGMPVVSTDCPCGGPKAVIRDGENGFLIPVGDEDALADRMLRLIEDKELQKRFSENARKIEDVGSIEAIYKQWKEYLEEVTSK